MKDLITLILFFPLPLLLLVIIVLFPLDAFGIFTIHPDTGWKIVSLYPVAVVMFFVAVSLESNEPVV